MIKLFSLRRLCKLFGHKPDGSDIADFTCLRCGEHVKVEWPRLLKDKTPIYGKSPLQTALDLGIMQYEKRITELMAERDQLFRLCKEAVTFPTEYRKHRAALKKIYQEKGKRNDIITRAID